MVKIKLSAKEKIELLAPKGALLSDVFKSNGIRFNQPCSGNGICGKCAVTINGEKHLACKYSLNSDIEVSLPDDGYFQHLSSDLESSDGLSICLDIGTTTLAFALISEKDGEIFEYISALNPQGVYGADVISRIKYCAENGPQMLKKVLHDSISDICIKMLQKQNKSKIKRLYAAGNTTMLHTFLGVDCSPLGTSPYKPLFLDKKVLSGEEIGLAFAEEVVLLPGISSFVGADIIAGLNFINIPAEGKYNLLIDLGTNAEIALMSQNEIICTSAAAGPCFEGVNISCGMSAAAGAIYRVDDNFNYSTIAGENAKGVCATGLIDLIATLRKKNVIDATGYMEEEEFEIAENVSISAEDIRQFQLAKSAVYSGIIALLNQCGISYDNIDQFYVAGGFSEHLNIDNAIFAGLFPKELKDKFTPLGNSCLKGIIKYSAGKRNIEILIPTAKYFDLSNDSLFSEEFIKNMVFH